MYCVKCGALLRDQSTYCHSCGSPLLDDVLIKAESIVQQYNNLEYELDQEGIYVIPPSPDGLYVSLQVLGSETIVTFDGWHDHYANKEDALHIFAKGLSGECRVKVESRCGIPYRWTVEERVAVEEWRPMSMSGILFPVLLPRKSIKYLRN